ncbi:MAG: NAD(P)-dependent oxidoreductase [Candidatus Omnitrophota bacterium]
MKKSSKPIVLLTGNTGYIGTVMTKLLKEQSYYVRGLDSDWFKDNYFFVVPEDSRPDKQIIKDIRNIAREDLDGVEAVIHLAALSNDPLGELNPGLTDEINHASAVQIAKLCKENGTKRFIFASSCSIYGKSGGEAPINEGSALNPITAYAKAKVDAEASLAALADNNFHPVFMRNATVYGLSPKLRLDLVVNNLLAWAYLTGEITIMSDGTPWRPILHIEDFCGAFIAALEAPPEKVCCQAFNVGQNEENYQVKDIAAAIREFLPEAKIKILNQTGPDERTYKVDFSKIKNTLDNFKPRWNLRKGIAELLEAYKKHNLTSDDFNSGKYFRLKSLKSLIEAGKL